MFTWNTGLPGNPRLIINFPTKGHWRSKSRLADVKAGLNDLSHVIRAHGIRSIAVPPLGCGNGGLDWSDVRPLIAEALGNLPDIEVIVYPPRGAPAAETMPVRTERPRMTAGRAALLALVSRYVHLTQVEEVAVSDGASALEIQKLMYFLQEAGQPLRLTYAKARYGPYADNLNHVLQAMEGRYLRGYGDRSRQVLALDPITFLPGAEDEARRWMESHPDKTGERIEAVMRLLTGFASPYGLELLSTVHWVATRESARQDSSPAALTQHIRTWSERKGRLFTEAHVRTASGRLAKLGWIPAA
jgi:O-acetyl-ADP-ribose deacetylase (regulator of RNase III)